MLDELLFSKLRCGLCFFVVVLLFLFNAQETGTGWSSSSPSPRIPRLTFSPLVSCSFHSLPMRVLLTVANNNTLPFCALDAAAILLPLAPLILPTCCFWACFSVCSSVCFVLFCFLGKLLLCAYALFLNFSAVRCIAN